MILSSKTTRRRFGLICIGTAVLMLIAGETVLKSRLTGIPLLGYWLTCFVLTAVAAGVAIIDAARVRRETKEEQRALLETTLREIEREKRARRNGRDAAG